MREKLAALANSLTAIQANTPAEMTDAEDKVLCDVASQLEAFCLEREDVLAATGQLV